MRSIKARPSLNIGTENVSFAIYLCVYICMYVISVCVVKLELEMKNWSRYKTHQVNFKNKTRNSLSQKIR